MKKWLLIAFFVCGLVQIPAQTNSLPNNGRGVRFGVLLPAGGDLPQSEQWILSYTQAIMTNNFSQYTAMTIIDKQNIDRIIDEQNKSLSGHYSDETAASIGRLIDSQYDLYGTIKKIPGNQYTVNFSVSHKETGQRIASFLENASLLQIHRTTVLNKASVNLMEQMGITLSTVNRQALLTDQNETVIAAQSSLARGITAERSGSGVEALSYYFQAVALDSSSNEINTRLSTTSQRVFTGDLQSNLQNEIQQKRAWTLILNECATAYGNVIPFELVMEPLQVGRMDVIKETQGFNIQIRLIPDPAPMRLLENVLEELLKLGEKMRTYGFVGSYNSIAWPKRDTPSSAKPVTFHRGFRRTSDNSNNFERRMEFNVVVALVNERGKEFRQTVSLPGQIDGVNPSGLQTSSIPLRTNIQRGAVSINNDGRNRYYTAYVISRNERDPEMISLVGVTRTLTFNIPADDLTDTYTMKIVTINDIDADTAALTGYMRSSTRSEYDRRTAAGRSQTSDDGQVSGDWRYINGIIYGYTGRQTSIVIPSTLNGENITAIDVSTFRNKRITDVTIPNSITRIGSAAFLNNPLTSITIGANVSMDDSSFQDNFTEFYNRNGKKAGVYTYSGNRWSYTVVSGDWLSNGSGTITGYRGNQTNIEIPSTLNGTRITAIASLSGKEFTSVIIPDGITRIGFVFSMKMLRSITIGANVNMVIDYLLDNSFLEFYDRNDRKAGVYTYDKNKWSYKSK